MWGNPNIKTKVLTDKITWPTGGRVDTQAKTTYNNSYTYGSTRPHAPTKIGLSPTSSSMDRRSLRRRGTQLAPAPLHALEIAQHYRARLA